MTIVPYSFRRIAAHVKRGGVIAYPTESCYGLGCDPRNRNAVMRVLKIKHRPQRKGLILVASRYAQVRRYIQPLDVDAQVQLAREGARAVTCLMPARHGCPRWLRGEHDTLAVRVTAHPAAAALCRALDMALVSTSANVGGDRPARSYADCVRRFGGQALVLPGRVGRRKRPSTITSWSDGKIIRK